MYANDSYFLLPRKTMRNRNSNKQGTINAHSKLSIYFIKQKMKLISAVSTKNQRYWHDKHQIENNSAKTTLKCFRKSMALVTYSMLFTYTSFIPQPTQENLCLFWQNGRLGCDYGRLSVSIVSFLLLNSLLSFGYRRTFNILNSPLG